MSSNPYTNQQAQPGLNDGEPEMPYSSARGEGASGYPPVYPQSVHHQQQPPMQMVAIQQQPLMGYAPNPHILPGMQHLVTLDQLFIEQKVELLEVFLNFETNNKYTIKDSSEQKCFYAVEDVDCCTRNCCGASRPFEMRIFDTNQREVAHFSRPLRCNSCWCPCFLQMIEVCCPPGNIVGYVLQDWSIFSSQFRIVNAAGDTILRIEGPFCTFSICGAVQFKVLSKDGRFEVGKISKQWSGLVREMFTDADKFSISFPMDLDVKMKIVMMAACFLIDFMFFENSGNKGITIGAAT